MIVDKDELMYMTSTVALSFSITTLNVSDVKGGKFSMIVLPNILILQCPALFCLDFIFVSYFSCYG